MPSRQFDLAIRVHADGSQASGVLGGLLGPMQNLGTAALAMGAGIAGGMGALIGESVRSNTAFEQYNAQFTVLLGSTDAAQKRMAELAEFGRTTPFDLPGVVEADRILQSFGLHAENVKDRFGYSGEEIRRIAGDMAAGTGIAFEDAALILGKFSSGATGEAIARMQELGIVTREQLAGMGVEFTAAGQMTTPVNDAMDILLRAVDDKFGGMMDVQSGTLDGMMSNLRDWAGSTLRELGRPFFDVFKQQAGNLLTFLESDFAKNALKAIQDFAAGVAEDLGNVIKGFGDFATALASGETPAEAIKKLITDLTGGNKELAAQISGVVTRVTDFAKKIGDAIKPITDWLSQNVSLKDILLGLGAAVATVVIPAIGSVIAAIAQVVAIFAGVVLAIALVRKAWEDDFLGIRTTLTDVWNNTLLPAFEQIKSWLAEIIPPIIDKLKAAWTDQLMPAFQEIGRIISEEVLPVFGNFEGGSITLEDVLNVLTGIVNGVADAVVWLAGAFRDVVTFIGNAIDWFQQAIVTVDSFISAVKDRLQTALQGLMAFWENNVMAPWRAAKDWIDATFIPLFRAIGNVAEAVLGLALRVLAGIWDNVLKPALERAWSFIDQNILSVFRAVASTLNVEVSMALNALASLWDNTVKPALERVWGFLDQNIIPIFRDTLAGAIGAAIEAGNTLITTMLDPLKNALSTIRFYIGQVVDRLNDMASGLNGMSLPDWLTPGSPTPFELGLRGINDAMQTLSQARLPSLSNSLAAAGAGGGSFGGSSMVQNNQTDNYHMTINTNAPAESALTDFGIMQSLAGRPRTN